jgi:hypothetical protein
MNNVDSRSEFEKNHLNGERRLIGENDWLPILISAGIGILGGLLIQSISSSCQSTYWMTPQESKQISPIVEFQESIPKSNLHSNLNLNVNLNSISRKISLETFTFFHWFHC